MTARDNAPPDRDLTGRLFSGGFTVLGVGFPAMSGALVALRDASLSTAAADALRSLVWLLLPAVVLCAAQSLVCLGTLSGLINRPRLAVAMTLLLIAYIMTSIVVWAMTTLLA